MRKQPIQQVAKLQRLPAYDKPQILERYLAANPDQLPAEELAIVAGWRQRITGEFYIVRYLKTYAVFTGWSIQREMDANLGIGFIQGHIAFVDGSRLEFSEQLPTTRQRFRIHDMDAQNQLIVRWDSAPHLHGLGDVPLS